MRTLAAVAVVLSPGKFEYERFRQFMTREAVAAVTAAKGAGATEILVSDSHGNGENLLIEQFPPDASTHNMQGVRAHTMSSAMLKRVAVNGKNMIFISGDDAAIAEAFSYLRIIERTDAHSIRLVAKDMPEASDFMEFVSQYSPALQS